MKDKSEEKGQSPQFRCGFVVLVGRPNSGKSTLLNAILKRKVAIVSDKPQTTRNIIRGIYTTADAQMIFIDTPGVHKPVDELGHYMVGAAKLFLPEGDVVLYVVDASVSPGKGEEYIMENILPLTSASIILVPNKIDLLKKEELLSLIAFLTTRFSQFAEVVPISALTGENIEELLLTVKNYLPLGPKYYPDEVVTDQPEEFVIAEIIREAVFDFTREEIPYAVAVEVKNIEQRTDGLLYIEARILVERESQKGIIIGKDGGMLKKIGTRARAQIETLLGMRIYLDLTVSVDKNWRKRKPALRRLGYSLNELY